MNDSAAPPRRRPRWPFVGAALFLVLAAALATGEWLGWPFLAAPLEQRLSAALDRSVRFASGSEASRVRVHFLGSLRLDAPQFEIGAPAWSSSPHLLSATDVSLELHYGDLLRAWRGQRLHVHSLVAATADGYVERLADGRASWQFGKSPQPASAPPSFGRMQVVSGTLRFNDALLVLELEARLALAGTPDGPHLKVDANGRYRGLPAKGELVAFGWLPWSAEEVQANAVPLTLNASIGRASLSFKGSAIDAQHLRGLAGHFNLSGPSLAAVGDPVGVTLPTTAAFRSQGQIARQGERWHVVIDDATVGASRLNGVFDYDHGRRVPLLSGRLAGTRLLIVDLGPVVGTTPVATAPAAPVKAPGKVLPSRPFDLAALRVMDADVTIAIDEVDLHSQLLEPLRPLRAHLLLAGGVLTLGELDARTGLGQLMGELRLDGRTSQALWDANLRWQGVRVDHFIHQARADGAPPFISGRLDGTAKLQGQGRSTAEILSSLKGRARTDLRDGAVSHLAIEAAGLDLAQGLGVLIKGDDALPVTCAVADLVADGGVFRPRVMVLDTSDSSVWVDGSLSLASETMDLRAVVAPKDFSPLTLRTPLLVRGSFAKPEVSIERGPAARKAAMAVLLALINPLAALIPLIDPGDSEAAQRGTTGCQSLQERRAAAAVAKPPPPRKG